MHEGTPTPLLSITLDQGGNKIPLDALADTGCSSGLSLTKEQVALYGLNLGKKINTEPLPAGIADGSVIACDVYRGVVEVGGERKLVDVAVVDSSTKLDIVEEEGDDEPDRTVLLGRGFMNHFDSHFSGFERKLSFLK